MKAILRLAGAVLGVICVGVLLAQGTIFFYLWTTGYVNRQKLAAMAAVVDGSATTAESDAAAKAAAAQDAQKSLAEMAEMRTIRSLNLDLREQSLHNSLARFEAERIKLQDESDRYKQLKTAFERDLALMRESVTATSEENARLILENIQPKQAKDQIIRMIDAGEMYEVVVLLSAMTVTRRAKIVGQFKTEDEAVKLAALLEAIRGENPEVDLIDDAEDELVGEEPVN